MTQIAPADIKFYLTADVAGAQPNANESLGGFASTTAWAGGTLGDLFDAISGDENAARDVEYRCIVVANDTASGNTLLSPKFWLSSQVAGGADIAIGLDPKGVVAKNVQAAALAADEGTAPAGVAFSAPADKASGLAPGDVAPGKCFAVWVRRTAANSAAINADGVGFTVEGDTGA